MLRPRGIPHDVDAETTNRIERTFLAVRIVRGSLLLLFLVVCLGAIVARPWPAGVTVAVALAAALQAARLTMSVRRYLHAATPHRREPDEGA
jgi:hypothetical protein